MDTGDVVNVVVALAVPVITAVLGAIGILVRDWRIRRDAHGRRTRALADATAQAAFVEQWWKAAQTVGVDPARLEHHSGQAHIMLAQAVATVARSPEPDANESDGPGAIRRVLLFYRFRSGWARTFRTVFHIWVFFLALSYIAGVAALLAGDEDRASLGYLSVGTVIFLLPAFGLRSLAVYAERRRQVRPPA